VELVRLAAAGEGHGLRPTDLPALFTGVRFPGQHVPEDATVPGGE